MTTRSIASLVADNFKEDTEREDEKARMARIKSQIRGDGITAPKSDISGIFGKPEPTKSNFAELFEKNPKLMQNLFGQAMDAGRRSQVDKLSMADTLLGNKGSLAGNASRGSLGQRFGLLSAADLADDKIKERDRISRLRNIAAKHRISDDALSDLERLAKIGSE